MTHLQRVQVGAQRLDRFTPVLGQDRVDQAVALADALRARLGGRAIWNINSTAVGGGVAEMLPPLLSYSRGHGIDTRWSVIDGPPEFFVLTKRIHHALHGSAGDGAPLDDAARALYERVQRDNAMELCAELRPRDVVILHDPQTAGMAPALIEHGALVIWRCHIGHDASNPHVEQAWSFLRPYLADVPALVFSRREYAPADFADERLHVIRPSIDAFAPKNQELTETAVHSILVQTGLIEGPMPRQPELGFSREDGTPGRVVRGADIVRLGRAPSADAPLVVQVSRWDPLKDMRGVMDGFARCVDGHSPGGAHLVLAGPNVTAVADDPEGPAVFDAVLHAWFRLPRTVREHVHIAMLPTEDVDENALIVNALQRHATVVVQKSLHEGFGLTVTEAMWKGRPVIASRVGGIQDQIQHRKSGLLLDDPTDLDTFAELLTEVLTDPRLAATLGAAAKQRVRQDFLGVRHLLQYAAVIEALDEA